MILIVGLGNPGEPYTNTPHNMGFRLIDALKEQFFSREEWETRYESAVIQGAAEGKEIILQKPLTFMNASGDVVKHTANAYGIKKEDIWVMHDDLDIEWGRIKVDFGRGSAGHKGVQSIIDALGTKAFWRIRVGVRPDPFPKEEEEIDRYLTDTPLSPKLASIEERVNQKVSEAITQFIKEGIKKTGLAP